MHGLMQRKSGSNCPRERESSERDVETLFRRARLTLKEGEHLKGIEAYLAGATESGVEAPFSPSKCFCLYRGGINDVTLT